MLRCGDLEEGFSRPSGQPWQSLGGGKCLVLVGTEEGLAQLEWGEGRRAGAMCASASGLSSRLPWRSGPFLPWKTLVLEQKCCFLGRCVVLAPCIHHPTMGCLFCPPLWAGGREATPSGKLILQDPKGTRGFQAWPWSWYLHEIPSSRETQAHHNPGERNQGML